MAVPLVCVFGSINTDLVVYLDRLPYPGETLSGGRFAAFPGGKGANGAVAAARSGARVKMYGAVGDDSYGRERLESLSGEGIDVSGIAVKPGFHSGIAQIMVDARGENSIAVAPGANNELRSDDIGDLERPDSPQAMALLQNEIRQDTSEHILRRCKNLGFGTVWNVAPECRSMPGREVLEATDFLVFNQNEIQAFVALLERRELSPSPTGDLSADQAADLAERIVSHGSPHVIVTLGPSGAVWVSAGGAVHQPAYDAAAVDTVGAGDCFCGYFTAALASGLAVEEALDRGAAAAAIAVTREGAQTSMPCFGEVEGFLSSRSPG